LELFDAIYGRRSIRKYRNEPVKRELLEKAIDAGRWAPSARSENPWKFVVLTDRERINKLQEIVGSNGSFLKQATAAIVVICKDTKYYLEDGCAATQNILLALYSLGIGSCWIAGDKKPYDKDVLNFIKAPDNYKLICIISAGIPDENPKKEKTKLKDVLCWEEFK